MIQILNSISVLSAFLFGTGMLYIIFDSTLGKIPFLRSSFDWRGLQIKDFAFLLLSAAIILRFTHFYQPY